MHSASKNRNPLQSCGYVCCISCKLAVDKYLTFAFKDRLFFLKPKLDSIQRGDFDFWNGG